jgi:radical SAM superfamily enzyme with C-terminal helix-hairpin-helix motif
MAFLKQIRDEGLLLRRINIRQVIGLEGTRLDSSRVKSIKRNQFFKHRQEIRETIDREMIQRVAPAGTILRSVFLEEVDGNHLLLRQLGTYPLLCHLPMGLDNKIPRDVFVVDHGPRSLTVLPYPFRLAEASMAHWKSIPGIGSKRAMRIKAARQIQSSEDLSHVLDMEIPDWLKQSLSFD